MTTPIILMNSTHSITATTTLPPNLFRKLEEVATLSDGKMNQITKIYF